MLEKSNILDAITDLKGDIDYLLANHELSFIDTSTLKMFHKKIDAIILSINKNENKIITTNNVAI